MATVGDVDRNVTITFIGRDNASRAMSSIGSSATRTSRIVTGLTKVLKAAALAAGYALAAAVALAAYALYDATKAAYADEVAMKKLADVQRRAQDATKAQTDATSDFIDRMELATGIADDELRPALTALATTGMSVKRSMDLTSLAADIAITKDKSLKSVAEALAKAYNGQITGLSRLGIKTTDAAGNARSLSEIMKELRGRFQGAARAAGKTDPLKRLGAAFNQIKEEVGGALLPVLKRFARWAVGTLVPYIKETVIPAFKRFTAWIKNEAVPFIQGKLIPAVKDIWNWFQNQVVPATRKMIGQFRKLGSQLGDLSDNFSDLMGTEGEGGMSLMDWLNLLGGQIQILTGFIASQVAYVNMLVTAFNNAADAAARYKDTILGMSGPAGYFFNQATSADGGYLKKKAMGGYTLVGEHGPELISNTGYVKTHSQTMGMSGGGAPTIIIQGAVDPVGTARQIRKILAKGDRASGRGQLGLA